LLSVTSLEGSTLIVWKEKIGTEKNNELGNCTGMLRVRKKKKKDRKKKWDVPPLKLRRREYSVKETTQGDEDYGKHKNKPYTNQRCNPRYGTGKTQRKVK